MPIAEHILNAIVNGFFIFNLRKDKNMVKSKDELLKYIADENEEWELLAAALVRSLIY
jgi:hypothetical protein